MKREGPTTTPGEGNDDMRCNGPSALPVVISTKPRAIGRITAKDQAMNDQVITTEELEAAHEEALQMNTQRDYFAEAAELGFSDVFAQAISTLGYGEYRPALSHLNQIRTFAQAENAERQQA